MSRMYQVGDLVIYGGSGVCQIKDIGAPGGSRAEQEKQYYTLAPVYGTEVIFVPVDTKVYMRPVLSRDEAEKFIRQIPSIEEAKINAGSLQLVSRQYQESLQSHECCDLVGLIKTIHRKDSQARKLGRKPGKIEEKYRKRAEDLLYGELSVALGIPRDNVGQYIDTTLTEV